MYKRQEWLKRSVGQTVFLVCRMARIRQPNLLDSYSVSVVHMGAIIIMSSFSLYVPLHPAYVSRLVDLMNQAVTLTRVHVFPEGGFSLFRFLILSFFIPREGRV